MIVYLSAPTTALDTVREYAVHLATVGYDVRTAWLEQPDTELQGRDAVRDLSDLRAAHLLVAFTPDTVHTTPDPAVDVEVGYALARHTRILLIGGPTSPYHRHPSIAHVPDWPTALLYLSRLLLDWNTHRPAKTISPLAALVHA